MRTFHGTDGASGVSARCRPGRFVKLPAGECGVKDQVSRLQSAVFVEIVAGFFAPGQRSGIRGVSLNLTVKEARPAR
jgi:hypothetical protein